MTSSGEPPIGEDIELPGTDGGVKKKILRAGAGEPPADGSSVRVHYVGTLLDGSKFDSSRDRDEPFEFKIGRGGVIKGWDKGVATMRPGELAVLTCRSDYAYGKRGSPPKIPADATLQFEVELLSWENRQKVTDDGGVMKQIIKTGEGYNRPNDNATVTIRYSGRVKDGATFIEAKEPVTFVLGNDPTRPEGLEAAVQNMYIGERALFTCRPDYGYGAKGNKALNIPPNAVILYEIEMVNFTKGRESWELNTEQKIELMTERKDQGNAAFKLEEFRRAIKRYSRALELFQPENDKDLKPEELKKINALRVNCMSNTAFAHAKQGDNEGVVKSCTEALQYDPNNVKCLFRRGQVYYERKMWDEAYADLGKAAKQEPGNKDVAKLYAIVKTEVTSRKQKEKSLFANMFSRVNFDDKKANKAAEAAPAETSSSSSEEGHATGGPSNAGHAEHDESSHGHSHGQHMHHHGDGHYHGSH